MKILCNYTVSGNDYDYYAAVKSDVLDYLNYNNINYSDYETLDDLYDYLNDILFVEDSVTGNASGSYTLNTYKAEEYLCHNLDLLADAYYVLGGADISVLRCPESCDVTIRCYVLPSALNDALNEIEPEFNAAHEK